ncbi:MAG: 50S ribosomal protein L11 methyltransferase [Prevotella sp.]
MKYLTIDFKITCDDSLLETARDLLADAAGEAGLEAFEEAEQGLRGYVQEQNFDRQALDAAVTDLMPGVTVSYEVTPSEVKDWNATWENEGFEPIVIDDRLIVTDARHTEAPAKSDGRIHIGICAVNSFGTGTHETTQMVLATLLDMDLKDKRVLDCGCGTGILGIAASKMGAADVVGYDIDEWCVNNARQNAELNKVENLQVFHGDACVLSHVNGIFDVVVANINRNILLADIPAFQDVMSREGSLIISGFYEQDIPSLLECAGKQGLKEDSRKQLGDWVCLKLSFV